jgi:thymidylate synthase
MRVIEGRDVNELYSKGMRMLGAEGQVEDSRVGKVLVMPMPVTSVYHKPTQRVLFDVRRGANPFFHLFESLWMLAGRNDVAALNRYITDFGTRFAETDGHVHGAYGHRWRRAFGFDQLDAIVKRLKGNPRDRQCVLQMWDARTKGYNDDAIDEGCNDLLGDWKDRPCNTQVYFRVREQMMVDGLVGSFTSKSGQWPVLDMTICCRSNDIVYGAYGANAVHFSILQEYVAGRVGALVGKMYQVSNNYHAYLDVLGRVGVPAHDTDYYGATGMQPTPMATFWDAWDSDLQYFMSWQRCLVEAGVTQPGQYKNSWFATTAEPMFVAHFKFKNAMHKEARDVAQKIEAQDWRAAALSWFDTRTSARSR